MIAYLICTSVVALGALIAIAGLAHQHAKEREKWAEERRELLNRIQRPDLLPTRPVENFAMPERKPDEWDKVGTVEYDVSDNGADG